MKISTPDEASAFVIFETLNARGRDLNSSDLLKNHLFRMAKGDKEVQESWDTMMEPFDFDSGKATRFIRSYWNGTHDFVTEKQLYRAMSREIKTGYDAKNFVNQMVSLSEKFKALLDPKNQEAFENEKLIYNLQILNMLGAKTFYPLVLIMSEKRYSEADITIVLHKIISFTIRNFTIGGLVANKYEKSFANIAKKVHSGAINSVQEINQLISAEMLDDVDFMNDMETASVSAERASRYIIAKIAYQDQEDSIDINEVRAITINDNVENRDLIGNKVLVTKAIASKAKKSAVQKQILIEQSKFVATNNMAHLVNKIDNEQILERQNSWKQVATEIWAK